MIIRAVSSRLVRLVLFLVLLVLSETSIRAASLSLGWSWDADPAAAGYEVWYGTASGNYTSAVDAGSNAAITISGLNAGTTYFFAVMVYDTNGVEVQISNEVIDAIPSSGEGVLRIVTQPASQTTNADSTALFSVGAVGAGVLTYQWFFNAGLISGATNATLTLANVSAANAGSYNAVVLNSSGFVMSAIVSLTVTTTVPVITIQPANQTANAGSTAVFAVAASGGSLTYQWYDNSVPIPGATNATLSVVTADATSGSYSVVVNNPSGSVTSSGAALSVVDPPAISVQPMSQSVIAGSPFIVRVGIYGTPPFTFQWYHNGAILPQQVARALNLTSVSPSDAGAYYVVVNDPAGSVTSATMVVTVTTVPTSATGVYNGLFYQTNNQLTKVTVPTAGMLGNCAVASNGIYSARLYIAGSSYAIGGTFDNSGNDTEIISRQGNGLPTLSVSLHADVTGASQILTGTVSILGESNPWQAPLVADLANTATPATADSYYMTIPPASSLPNSPQGYAVISVTSGGMAILAGRLYDGSQIFETVPVSNTGIIPLYFPLYGGAGLMEGWVSVAGGLPTGSITWIRPTGANSPIPYPNGFTNVVNVY